MRFLGGESPIYIGVNADRHSTAYYKANKINSRGGNILLFPDTN